MTFPQFASNNVIRNFRTYLAYFLSSTFSVMVFFSFAVCMFHPSITNSGMQSGSAAAIALATAEAIIFMFSFLFILYSLSTFLKSRMNEFGTLMILGMSKQQLRRMILIENIVIGFLAITTGLIVGLAFSKFFLLLTSKVMMMNIESFYFPLKAIILTFSVFILLFICISIITTFVLRTDKVINLLKGSRKPKVEPKASMILSALSIITISSGYILAVNGDSMGVSNGFAIVVSMVIIGTFLFFSQFSIFAINLMKNKRKFYMNRINMLWISDLAYRIRDNARMLSIVTIVSTVAFTSIASLYVINVTQKTSTAKKFPFAFSYISLKENTELQEHLGYIDKLLGEKHFKYEKVKADLIKQRIDEKSDIYVISASDYNKIAEQLNMKKVKLSYKQAILVSNYAKNIERKKLLNIKNISLSESKTNFDIVGVAEHNVLPIGVLGKLIVVDDSQYNIIQKKGERFSFYGYNVVNWENTLEITNNMNKKLIVFETNKPYYFFTAADMYKVEQQQSSTMLFMGSFIGIIFFIGAGSFLYFRFYTDLNQDKDKYRNITKIGLTHDEMKKTATIQIAALFFIPYIVAAIHTSFALESLSKMADMGVALHLIIVLIAFFVIQLIYFFIIRSRYIKSLLRHIV